MESTAVQLLEELIDEVRLGWHVLIQVGERLLNSLLFTHLDYAAIARRS